MSSNEWNTWKIGDIGRIVTGKTPPTQNLGNFGHRYPFITPRDMLGQKQIHQTERYLSEEGKNTVKNCLLPANSVCVSCIGSDMGKVVMTTTDSVTNQQLNSVICKASFDPDFVYYAFVHISDELRNAGHHSTAVPILNKTDFSNFEITAPDIVTQRRIGNILSALDDKIKLNRQTNAILEAIAQTIFKEWFVDFNFPGATGEMVVSELGMIPRGWRVGKLGEIVEFLKGVSYQSSDLQPSNRAMVTLKSINRGGGLNFDGFKEFTGKYKGAQVLVEGDLVISQTDITQNADVVGCPAIVENPFNYEKLIASLDLVKCKPKSDAFSSETLFYFFKQQGFKDYCLSHTNGSTVLHLRSSELPNYTFIIPDEKILKDFGSMVNSIRSEMINNNVLSRSLIEMGSILLPKLMSGEIEV